MEWMNMMKVSEMQRKWYFSTNEIGKNGFFVSISCSLYGFSSRSKQFNSQRRGAHKKEQEIQNWPSAHSIEVLNFELNWKRNANKDKNLQKQRSIYIEPKFVTEFEFATNRVTA